MPLRMMNKPLSSHWYQETKFHQMTVLTNLGTSTWLFKLLEIASKPCSDRLKKGKTQDNLVTDTSEKTACPGLNTYNLADLG